MLAASHLGAFDPMLGLYPNLILGSEYRVTRGGVAIAMTTPVLAMLREIQELTNLAANLFGIPGSITVDGKIGPVTGGAFKFVAGNLSDDLRRNISDLALGGNPAAVAKDARNVIGTLKVAIEDRRAGALVATAPAPVARLPAGFVPTTVKLTAPLPTRATALVVKTAPLPTRAALPVTTRLVSTGLETRRRLSTPAFVAVLAAFMAAGIGAAVLVARRD